MGLAASQARFLAITARKADCEYRSMAIAQEKLSITRELSKVTEEYQKALDATKLVWDGETEDGIIYDLSYDIMMSPSELNGYSPFLVTNKTGQIVLSEQLAKACEAAGLDPVSGTGSLDGRNRFVEALASVGYISGTIADVITGATGEGTIEWSDKAGFGGQMLDKSVAQAMTLPTMVNYFENVLDPAFREQFDPNSEQYTKYNDLATKLTFTNDGTYGTVYKNGSKYTEDFTIVDLLTSNVTINFNMNETDFVKALKDLVKDRSATEGAIDGSNAAMSALADISNLFRAVLPVDAQTEETQAFEFALNETIQQIADNTDSYGSPLNTPTDEILTEANNQNGGIHNNRKGMFISLSNMVEMFLTNYAIALGGYESGYYNSIKASESNFVTNDYNYMYVMNQPESVYEEKEMMIADFINVLYNNICNHGWTRSSGDVTDNDYLQNALKNGQYFISSLNTDMYYYQDHYTANGCVGEVTNDEAITLAESEYTIQKNKLNYKEETLDIEMKNLDLEISALTTEYDTVKSMISKNVEKVFTMFNS